MHQSSIFEEAPYLIKCNYNVAVINSGVYNFTLENARGSFVRVELTTMTSKNVTVYPFESFFYYGLITAALG